MVPKPISDQIAQFQAVGAEAAIIAFKIRR